LRTVGAYEAKTNLSRLLDEVEAGETISITKHGRIVAILTPPGKRPNAGDVIDSWLRERQHVRLGSDLSIRDLINEGRRN
jgi:prevent-host-death family protein